MKYRIFFFVAVILFVFSTCFAVNAVNNEFSKDGFRGIGWGTEPSQLGKDKKLFGKEPALDMAYYTLKNENLSFGSAKLKRVIYVYIDDKFTSVMLQGKDRSQYGLLKEAVIGLIGQPNKISSPNNEVVSEMLSWERPPLSISLIDYKKENPTLGIISNRYY